MIRYINDDERIQVDDILSEGYNEGLRYIVDIVDSQVQGVIGYKYLTDEDKVYDDIGYDNGYIIKVIGVLKDANDKGYIYEGLLSELSQRVDDIIYIDVIDKGLINVVKKLGYKEEYKTLYMKM